MKCESCEKKYRSYKTLAKCRWGKKAVWIEGQGQYALLSQCKELTVTLWETLELAEKKKWFIDQTGCGGMCCKDHSIIELPSI